MVLSKLFIDCLPTSAVGLFWFKCQVRRVRIGVVPYPRTDYGGPAGTVPVQSVPSTTFQRQRLGWPIEANAGRSHTAAQWKPVSGQQTSPSLNVDQKGNPLSHQQGNTSEYWIFLLLIFSLITKVLFLTNTGNYYFHEILKKLYSELFLTLRM